MATNLPAEDVLARLRRICDRDTCTCSVHAGIREIERLRDEVDRLDKKCSALAFLQYGRPETKASLAERLNAEIDRLDFDSAAAESVGADECVRFDDAVLKILKRIRGDRPPECSSDPGNCPENEGHGCDCSPEKAPAAHDPKCKPDFPFHLCPVCYPGL